MRVLPSGSTALLVELDGLDEVLGLYAALVAEPVEGVVDVVKDLELVGGLAQLLRAGLRRPRELALGLGNDLAGGAEDGAAVRMGGLLQLGAPATAECNP